MATREPSSPIVDQSLPDYASNAEQCAALPVADGSATPFLDSVGLADPEECAPSGASYAGIPATKGAALARHTAFTRKVRGILGMALGQDIDPGEDDASELALLRNSAEFVDSSRLPLRVLTPTHDSDQRIPPAGMLTYFDGRLNYDDDGADYVSGSPDGIVEAFPEWGHFDAPTNELFVADPDGGRSENSIIETIVHETQHAVDSGPGNVWERKGPQRQETYEPPPWVWEYYRTEYRARIANPANLFGDPANKAPRKTRLTATRNPADPEVGPGKKYPLEASEELTLANEQQQRIFDDLIQDPSIVRWYDHQERSWLSINGYFAHFVVLDPSFRAFVEAYGETEVPSGGNLVNSIRITKLSEDLVAGAAGVVLRNDARALDDIDRAFLRDRAASAPFWKLATETLLPARTSHLAMLQAIVDGDRGPDPGAATYTVVEGDTLGLIAARVLGDRGRWQELVDANPSIDPDRIEPGDQLVLP